MCLIYQDRFRTFLSILAVLINAEVRMVSILPMISYSSIFFPNTPTIIGSTVCHSRVLSISKYLFNFSPSFILTMLSAEMAKSTRQQIILLILLIYTKSDFRTGNRSFVCISKSISFSCADFSLCIYSLVVWSNFNLLLDSHLISFPTQSCLVLNTFCFNLLHSLIS